jgi:hypothetical protein
MDMLGGMEAKDAAAIGGIVLNLVLNIFNLRRTSKLRSDTLRLEEFKRLRAPVDAAYAAIRDHRNTLRSLEASGSSVTKVRKDVSECNKALAESYNSLCDALADLDRSKLIHGTDWISGVSDQWDQIVAAFDGAYVREKNLSAMKEAIRKIIVRIDNLLKLLHSRLDAEIV